MTFVNASVPLNGAADAIPLCLRRLQPPRRRTAPASIAARSTRATGRRSIRSASCPVIEPTVVDASGTAGVRGVSDGWNYDASGQYGHNSFAFTIGDTLNVSLGPSLPPNKTAVRRRHAGAEPVRRQRRHEPAVRGQAASPARSTSRSAPSIAARTTRSAPASRTRIDDGGVAESDSAAVRPIGAQVFPGFRPSNEVDESRDSVAGYVDVEGERRSVAAARRRRARGALQRLRRHGRRQAHRARAARSALRRARLGEHRLPRAVARRSRSSRRRRRTS